MILNISLPLMNKKLPYQKLTPYFEDIFSTMEGLAQEEDILHICKYLNDQIILFKTRFTEKMRGNKQPPGKLVSFGHPSCR